jgi:Putative peptidoglycan binding domain
LTLALSRIRSNSVPLRGPVRPSAGETIRQKLSARVKVGKLPLYLGAALSVALVGIGVNALVFQRVRHPAPLFGSATPSASVSAPAPTAPPAPKPASAERDAPAAQSLAALPPARPADAADAPTASPSDPITDLLRGEARVDGERLTLAAQTALVKLGYPVKADGNDGLATQQALRDFERVHGLPLSSEITPRLLKQLTSAARVGGR